MEIEKITAVVAAVIAAGALTFTIYQAYLTRKYQFLSVKPHINVDYKFFPNKPLEIRILNNGVGPAFFKSFQILFDKTPIQGSNSEAYEKIVKKFKEELEVAFTYEYNFPLKNEAMPAGSSEILLSINVQQKFDKKTLANCISFLSRFGVEIEYQNLFGTSYNYHMPLLFSNH